MLVIIAIHHGGLIVDVLEVDLLSSLRPAIPSYNARLVERLLAGEI